MRGIIVAISANNVIGVDNKLPWHYPADLKRFRRVTSGTTVIMGRLTYESIGKPLPNRRNIVVTSSRIVAPEGGPAVECVTSVQQASAIAGETAWFIGGARIFAEAMPFCDLLDVTFVPDVIEARDPVLFPPIKPGEWQRDTVTTFPDDPRLKHTVYHRVP